MTAARTTSAAEVGDVPGTIEVPVPRHVAVPLARRSDHAASAQQGPAANPDGPARPSLLDDRWILAGLFALPLGVCVRGLGYYSAPLAERLRDPLHPWLKPGGTLGLTFGLMGFLMFVFMWLYPLRKKVRALAWTGSVGNWMRVHIVAGLAVPVIAAAHAGWRFEGLIGLGYLSMLVVSFSGVVGRYLYVHIPRSRNGLELSMEDVNSERRALLTNLSAATGLVPAEIERRLAVDAGSYAGLDPLRTLWRMFQDDLRRGRTIRELKAELLRPHPGRRPLARHDLAETMRLARRELALAQQVRMLEATRRVFGYWHVAHRPFAVTAFIAVLVHVIVAMTIGGVGFGGGR